MMGGAAGGNDDDSEEEMESENEDNGENWCFVVNKWKCSFLITYLFLNIKALCYKLRYLINQ